MKKNIYSLMQMIIRKRIALALLSAVLWVHGTVYAQDTGTISGNIIDASSGEPIIGVTVVVEGSNLYSVTDINGAYQISGVKIGECKLVYQMMGYQTMSIAASVSPGKGNRVNASMSFRTAEEVVITGKRISNTEASLISSRKKSAVSQDAISAE